MRAKFLNDVTVIMTWYGQENHLFNQMQFYNSMAQRYPKLTPRLIVINDGHEKGREYFHEVIIEHRERLDLTGIELEKNESNNFEVVNLSFMGPAEKKGVEFDDIKNQILKILDDNKAKYPAEHNVGHLYEADHYLRSFYQ